MFEILSSDEIFFIVGISVVNKEFMFEIIESVNFWLD